MRWNIFYCLFLATIALSSAHGRPKRSLGYIMDLFGSKLRGTNKVIIAEPIFNNKTVKLYSIPGNNDFLIKVTNENKKETQKENDPVIVKPEVAIIGTYLGTKSQSETQRAVEIAKNLMQSGILNGNCDKDIQKIVLPIPKTHVEFLTPPINVFEQREPAYMFPVPQPIIQETPPLVFAPEIQFQPVNPQYSYQQQGVTADTTYESFNGKDVIVTRTEKEPPIPEYIKLRLQDVSMIGANPYLIPGQVITPNMRPIPYMYQPAPNQVRKVLKNAENFGNNVSKKTGNNVPLTNGVANPLQVNVRKSNVQGNKEANANENTNKKTEEHKTKIEQLIKNQTVDGNLVSQYVYKQLNRHSTDKLTKVNIDNEFALTNAAKVMKDTKQIPNDFVYIPPKDLNSPNVEGFINTNNLYTSKPLSGNVENMKNDVNFKVNPIVVIEDKTVYERRGDIP